MLNPFRISIDNTRKRYEELDWNGITEKRGLPDRANGTVNGAATFKGKTTSKLDEIRHKSKHQAIEKFYRLKNETFQVGKWAIER